MTRIALIHAVQAAVAPVQIAFKELWPEARTTNLLDDSLSSDREVAKALTPGLSARIGALADYAASSGADGILYTCSAFGSAIEAAAARLPIPVLKPNEAMFEKALDLGKRVGMLATFAPAIASMEEEFREMAAARGGGATLETYCVPGAREALTASDLDTHDRLIAEAVALLPASEVIVLAHFSMATAVRQVQAVASVPVLTAPYAAVEALRSRL
ncbi:MAG TPA: aspartate/glutamate racemase family protein [Bradyrhizobium sp.]|nr:aspartate/glutamate racemase family protein [Bradyrhizobium sp.]